MIELLNISHDYGSETILHDISLTIEPSSFNIISGESGSGKSTLLSIVSTLLRPTRGLLRYDGVSIADIPDIDRFRNERIGFIFQFHYLIAHLTIYENIAMVTRRPRSEIMELLTSLGIDPLASKYPDEVSGGQRQRAAVARAIINRPSFIFADEPTGNLDSHNSENVFSLLRSLDATLIVATHDHTKIKPSDRVISLKDGRLC